MDGGQAKKLGRQVTLRPDWEQIKDSVMEEVIHWKFKCNKDLAEALINTGDAILIEGNTWNDRYWGVCRGTGQNKLGKILMKERDRLREETGK